MKYRYLVASILAGAAFAASAQNRVIVDSAEACPAGTAASVPAYHWQDGRLVQDGVLCESIYRDSRG